MSSLPNRHDGNRDREDSFDDDEYHRSMSELARLQRLASALSSKPTSRDGFLGEQPSGSSKKHAGRPHGSTSSTATRDPEGSSSTRSRRSRIKPAQLAILERAFEFNQHPSRDARNSLAAELNMESKSVTIWFQNRRQASRKEATRGPSKHSKTRSSSNPRVSLDRVASQRELPPPRPRYIYDSSYHPDHTPHIWGHMVSSPSPPPSPGPSKRDRSRVRSASPSINAHRRSTRHGLSRAASDYSLATSRQKKGRNMTLEWACENASRFPPSSSDPDPDLDSHPDLERDDDVDARTDITEEQEAITPLDGRSLESISIRSSQSSDTVFDSSDITQEKFGFEKSKFNLLRDGIFGSKESIRGRSMGRTVRNPHLPIIAFEPTTQKAKAKPKPVNPHGQTEMEMDAALALCGLFASSG